jgi:hypothetical protein
MILAFPYMLALACRRMMYQTGILLKVRKRQIVVNMVSMLMALALIVAAFKQQRRAKLSFKPYKRKRKRFQHWG